MSLLLTSLNAVTATGAGGVLSLHKPLALFAMQVTYTGSPTNVEVDFEGTLDGINFTRLFVMQNQNGQIGGGPQNGGYAGPYLCIAVRANLIALTGGTSPTVTATIAAR